MLTLKICEIICFIQIKWKRNRKRDTLREFPVCKSFFKIDPGWGRWNRHISDVKMLFKKTLQKRLLWCYSCAVITLVFKKDEHFWGIKSKMTDMILMAISEKKQPNNPTATEIAKYFDSCLKTPGQLLVPNAWLKIRSRTWNSSAKNVFSQIPQKITERTKQLLFHLVLRITALLRSDPLRSLHFKVLDGSY